MSGDNLQIDMAFSQRLDEMMAQAGVTRKGLARELCIHPSLVTRWLKGQRRPGLQSLERLVRMFVAEWATMTGMEAGDWIRLVHPEVTQSLVEGWCRNGRWASSGVPAELGHWVWQPAIDELRQRLLAQGREAEPILGVVGMPGVGKSTLLRAIAHDPAVLSRYERVVYVGAGRDLTLESVLELINVQLRHTELPWKGIQPTMTMLRQELGKRPTLVLIDDVWTPEVMEVQQLSCGRCRILIATRQEDLICVHQGGRARVRLDPMDTQRGVMLLARHMGPQWHDAMTQQAARVVDLVGGLPLALVIVAAQVGVDGWDRCIDWLSRPEKRLEMLELPGATSRLRSVRSSISLSFQELDQDHQAVLLAAGHLPNPVRLEQVANILGVDVSIIYQRAKLLAWRHLIRVVGGNLDLHVLIRDFVRGI